MSTWQGQRQRLASWDEVHFRKVAKYHSFCTALLAKTQPSHVHVHNSSRIEIELCRFRFAKRGVCLGHWIPGRKLTTEGTHLPWASSRLVIFRSDAHQKQRMIGDDNDLPRTSFTYQKMLKYAHFCRWLPRGLLWISYEQADHGRSLCGDRARSNGDHGWIFTETLKDQKYPRRILHQKLTQSINQDIDY